MLGFDWPKMTQMTLIFMCFFRIIFKYVQDFFVRQKTFLQTFFFLQGFLNKNSENFFRL